jgi:guanylate kinase
MSTQSRAASQASDRPSEQSPPASAEKQPGPADALVSPAAALPGPLIILSGPSGVGKSAVVQQLLARTDLPLHLAVSATTRPPRPGEVDGRHYYFWPRERFEHALAAGQFLEHAEVFGNLYGTLRSEVEPYRQRGCGVLLEIDVQGAAQIRRLYPEAVSIFLTAPSLDIYEQRLRGRHTDSEETIRRRLAGAAGELAHLPEYDYVVINDNLERTVAEVEDIIRRQFGGAYLRRNNGCTTN